LLVLDVQAAGLVAAIFFIFSMEAVMYSNEREAILSAVSALTGALGGGDVPETIAVEGGRDYDGTREVCAKILEAATAAKALEARIAALEA
jgi:hypothetical protein